MSITEDVVKLAKLLDSRDMLVFDFDGVLVDSVEIKTEVFASLYEPFGAEVVAKVVSHHREHGGMSRFEKFRHYHREFLGQSIGESKVIELAEAFAVRVKQAVVSAPEIPGALMVLKYFCGRGKICAVNSATPEEELIDIVRQRSLSDYFVRVCGAPTSKAANLGKILCDFSMPAEKAVFFGDARADLDAALSNGVEFIGVGNKIRGELAGLDKTYSSIIDFQQFEPVVLE